jgi:Kef-type K+ transport system membrane component KefB/nucleotide-binding universal stress UspA family protein
MTAHNVISAFFAFVLANGGQPPHPDLTTTVFVAEVLLMLLVGRLLGELMQRVGQPAVLGQLLAGILLGPTVLGTLWPAAHHAIFPSTPEQKKMIDAVSQLGILMLLLLAGMETDFTIVKRMRRAALSSSLAGIVFPFACGLLLGALLPDSMLPEPEKRIVTALFLATALSISSVKVVAMVIMEVDFMRRNIGQLILASAIIDDTVGWIILAMISGIAAEGTLNLKGVSLTVGGTLIFLALSFTFGRRIVAHVIRWTNDNLRIEFAVLSAILVLMCLMSLITELIGVHTVLGAFVVGILVGQSPILTKQIQEQIRGLIIALFAPIFFAVAGLSVDLTILRHLYLIELAVGLILIASLGKLVGCYVGGRLGRLSSREATALAIGMNARGTTEIIVATIGLSIGVVSQDIYTLIVVMAVTTTMVMPPMLRWALRRIPPTGEEKYRLEREQAEKRDFVPKVERLLITADQSEDGKLASILGGLFAGSRQIMATVLDLGLKEHATHSVVREKIEDWVKLSIEFAARKEQNQYGDDAKAPTSLAQLNTQLSTEEPSAAVLKEVKKGYDMLFIGLEHALSSKGEEPDTLHTSIEKIVSDVKGVLAIVVAKDKMPPKLRMRSMDILVPTSGAEYSRRAGEVAIAIAKACRCGVTVLHVYPPQDEGLFMRRVREHLEPARALVRDLLELGEREGVPVKTVVKVRRAPERAILKQITKGKHNLVVLGVKVRPGEGVFFGHKVKVLLERVPCSLLVVSS